MKTNISPRSARGFGLIEVLAVIAIIGVMASVVIPHIDTSKAAQTARDRRHAQELSSFSVAAEAAGLKFVVPGNLTATLDNVLQGGTPRTGSFRGRAFIAPKISRQDAQSAARFLKLEDDALVYSYDGTVPGSI